MMRLKSKLLSLNANKKDKVKVYSPRNCEELRIPFKTDKLAKLVGKLASMTQPSHLASPSDPQGQIVTGVLVQNDFKLSLMAPEDLKEYAGLTTTTIMCRQRITLACASVELIRWALEGTFGSITTASETTKNGVNGDTTMKDEMPSQPEETMFEIMGGAVCLICRPTGEIELEWEGNATNDSIADAVMAVLLSVETSPAAIKRSSQLHSHDRPHEHNTTYDAFVLL